MFQKKAFDSPKVEVNMKNKKGTIVMLVAFIMAAATLFSYLTTPRYEKRKYNILKITYDYVT
ncbi:hypothetical protein SAMN04487934_101523 [Eubacterium ruminantium]|nr:hypothetical protein SAMN04487934_101523 [Eubacterium ruminantium]